MGLLLFRKSGCLAKANILVVVSLKIGYLHMGSDISLLKAPCSPASLCIPNHWCPGRKMYVHRFHLHTESSILPTILIQSGPGKIAALERAAVFATFSRNWPRLSTLHHQHMPCWKILGCPRYQAPGTKPQLAALQEKTNGRAKCSSEFTSSGGEARQSTNHRSICFSLRTAPWPSCLSAS